MRRRLSAPDNLGQLLARAAVEARAWCGFSRGIILPLDDGYLVAHGIEPIADEASEALRRLVLADPIPLRAGSEEAEIVRRANLRVTASQVSVVGEALSLAHRCLAPVVADSRVAALLVLDRSGPDVDAAARDRVEIFAQLVGYAAELVALRSRMRMVAAELRELTDATQGLVREAIDAPVAIPRNRANVAVFQRKASVPPPTDDVRALLTEREIEIVSLMVSGRSNRAIADQLCLSPETVKNHVGRILSKLGAANRVEAVARYLRLTKVVA